MNEKSKEDKKMEKPTPEVQTDTSANTSLEDDEMAPATSDIDGDAPGDDATDEAAAEEVDPIAELEEKLKVEHERLLRATADLDNFRKRSRRDVEDAVVRGKSEVLREILPVIDSIDLALASADPEGPAAGIIEGVQMVRNQFLSATDRFGLKPIESIGLAFDPNFHEAVAQAPSDKCEPGQIIEEMRKGYVLQDRLLRAAMVIVAQKPKADESGPSDAPEEQDDTPSGDRAAERGANEG